MADAPDLLRLLVARWGGAGNALAQTVIRRSSARALARQLRRQPPSPRDALASLLDHAAARVPYWRERLRDDGLAALASVPPLTKDELRAHEAQLRSDDLGQRRWWVTHSGGSSGTPIGVVQDRAFADWSMATSDWYFHHHLGVHHEVPKVVLWGSERDLFGQRESIAARVRGVLTQTTLLNSFKMDPGTMRRHIERIAQARPVYIRGYAGSLYELARFAETEGLRLFRPAFLYSSAETLQPEMRQVIERAFAAPVFDFYGSREVGPIAGQGRDGAMHVFGFFNLVEVVDAAGQRVPPGGHGRVLVTTLRNHAMPLLRYELGDTAVVGDVDPDGFVRTLSRVTGRVTDHFVTRDGGLVHGEYFTHLFYGVAAVREFQVVQQRIDSIEILWTPRDGATVAAAARQDIDAKIRLVLGDSCDVQWREVAQVPLTPQGKRLFTRSLVHARPAP